MNLHRAKIATLELLKVAKDAGVEIALVQEPYVGSSGIMKEHPGTRVIQCTTHRQIPVKAAIIIFGDRLKIVQDSQLITETEVAVTVIAGSLTIGVVSIYLEGDKNIHPYLNRIKNSCEKLNTEKILVAGDVNAWSQWWGSIKEDERGRDYCAFLNEMGFHLLNNGDTPTFETFRNGRMYTSIIDVTACSQQLLGKIYDWEVNRSLITSDHNAITFTLRLGRPLESATLPTTRRYFTKKAKWFDFSALFKIQLEDRVITLDFIRDVKTPAELDTLITSYTDAIHDACVKTIPKLKAKVGNPIPPWWSSELEALKADALRKKRRIKNAAPSRRNLVIEEYMQAKVIYAEEVTRKSTQGWKDFCTSQDKESMWDKIYRVIRNTSRRQEDLLLKNQKGLTLTPQKSAELLAETFYPDDNVLMDQPNHMRIRELANDGVFEGNIDDPPFAMEELETILNTQNPKKAPGPDGLTADICVAAIRCNREVFLALANKCLTLTHFPTQWKVAHVVILRKPGKEDYSIPKSLRPIGLLPVLGKLVEKLLITRIQWHILPTLNPNQYGFMPQRSTEDALYKLVGHLQQQVDSKKIAILVSLDIEGAFDNAWWPTLKLALREKKCPRNLYAMVCSYLTNRRVAVNYAGTVSEKITTKGCVQGSIGGPTFWNIILDSLLQKLNCDGVYCQAFADDVALVFADHSTHNLEQMINSTLETVVEWGNRNKLNFAAHKTNAMLLTRKTKYDPLRLCMSGTTIELVKEIKILGLVIDHRLSFKSHVSAQIKKAANIYKQLACAAKVYWGLNSDVIRTIYVAVVEPIIMYAASAWSRSTDMQAIQDQLNALQRGFAQKICKAYRTVSLVSALSLSGLLPLDIRIKENASLYKVKRGLCKNYLPSGKELEVEETYLSKPHPSTQIAIEFELLEDLNPSTIELHHIEGALIFTDGSKIKGKVGAALSRWDEGKETGYEKFSLHPNCTVFQSELYALDRAIRNVADSNDSIVNILSDSRSSLELLRNPNSGHPLAKTIRESVRKIKAQGREIRLFWLKAHVGIVGNERADELAKAAALAGSDQDYDKIPLSYVKEMIRKESVRIWQDRYETSQTGAVTKKFLPDVEVAYRITRTTVFAPFHVQMLTGHGGIAEYLYRFKLKNSPSCECDLETPESVTHILFECPRFAAYRFDLQTHIEIDLTEANLPSIMVNSIFRKALLDYAVKAFSIACRRNSTRHTGDSHSISTPIAQTSTNTHIGQQISNIHPQHTNIDTALQLLQHAQRSKPGLRIISVALYMDENTERLGISFCKPRNHKYIAISPGLASLLNGSTKKIAVRRKIYEALPTRMVGDITCRVVKSKNKSIILLDWGERTPFARACELLHKLSETTEQGPRIISIDAMVVEYNRGEVADRLGCIMASKQHEVIVYEDRGEDLSYLKPAHSSTQADHPQTPLLTTESGSERLQRLTAEDKTKSPGTKHSAAKAICRGFSAILGNVFGRRKLRADDRQAVALEEFTRKSTEVPAITSRPKPTKAAMDIVQPPDFLPIREHKDHYKNAMLEFLAVLKATKQVKLRTCKEIILAFQGGYSILGVKLKEAEGAIYNSDSGQTIAGSMKGNYMAAYNATSGFVELNEEETRRTGYLKFNTPANDPMVVTAKCTRIMLEERMLEMALRLDNTLEFTAFSTWKVPKMIWVNGVPGCGKTTWIVKQFDIARDTVVTSTTEAANELRERLSERIGNLVKNKIRTMSSMLVNGARRESDKCNRLIVDEALMNHFGAIVMAGRISGAEEILLIGDVNQLPYIDRENLFEMIYRKPPQLSMNQNLVCTHRSPMDVAYALREIYPGIYSSKRVVRSLSMKDIKMTPVPGDLKYTLYLTFTQEEKESLIAQGWGGETGSKVLTIHESQGLTSATVIVVNTKSIRLQLHDSVSHAVVAISRHTDTAHTIVKVKMTRSKC